jgi:uncharacterized radical SAM superfamily protein
MSNVSYNNNDNYTTIVVKSQEIDTETSGEILKSVKKFTKKGSRNFIMIGNKIQVPNKEFSNLIKKLNDDLFNNTGIFIVAKPTESIEDILDELGIIHTPTLEEAIDYVFMEDIGREIGGKRQVDEEDDWN